MEALFTDLRRLGSHEGKDGYEALCLLYKVLKNIDENPSEKKYHLVSGQSPRFQQAISFSAIHETLLAVGFVRKVIYFEEKWHLQRANPIALAKIHDLVVYLGELVERYRGNEHIDNGQAGKDVVSFHTVQQHQRQQKEYWNKMTKDAEEDRLEKLQREERELARLRKFQQKRDAELEKKKWRFRQQFNLLDKPPAPPSIGIGELGGNDDGEGESEDE